MSRQHRPNKAIQFISTSGQKMDAFEDLQLRLSSLSKLQQPAEQDASSLTKAYFDATSETSLPASDGMEEESLPQPQVYGLGSAASGCCCALSYCLSRP